MARHEKVTQDEHDALTRLLQVAAGNTGQSRRLADFLLAWWNAGSCGGFDLTTAWGLDAVLADDVVTVFALAVRCGSYPDTLGYSKQFEGVVHAWRPELLGEPASNAKLDLCPKCAGSLPADGGACSYCAKEIRRG